MIEGNPQGGTRRTDKQPSPTAKASHETVPSGARRQGQGIQCHTCHKFGHIAKFCRSKLKRNVEAPGRSKESNTNVVTTIKELSSEELAEELSRRRLEGEQELLAAQLKSKVQLVTGTVGPSYWLDVLVEGIAVSAMVDTESQSTIVSRTLLHKVFKRLEREGKALPKLGFPSTKLKGKGGHLIDVTYRSKIHNFGRWKVY